MEHKIKDEPGNQRRIRQTNELLQELRGVLPGVQVLFAFLLTVAFTRRFTELALYQQNVYFAALMSAALAAAFLTAPTAQHRLLWRQHEKSHRLRLANALTIAGSVFLAVAVSCVVFPGGRRGLRDLRGRNSYVHRGGGVRGAVVCAASVPASAAMSEARRAQTTTV